MDRKGATKKKDWKPIAFNAFFACLMVGGIVGTFMLGMSFYPSTQSGKKETFVSRWMNRYASALVRVQDQVDELKRADEENIKLRSENAHLRLVLESHRFECYAERSEKMTQEFEHKLSQETLSRTGRTLASLSYKVPTDLMPKELYGLGMQYFRSRDDEKAAVIFTFLTGMEEEDTFKTPSNLMLTGVAWYRLEHFEKADFYFDQVLKLSEESGSRLGEQARLWKGLVSERLGKHVKAQYWLREVLDHDPHSIEASWVNHSKEVKRETASEH